MSDRKYFTLIISETYDLWLNNKNTEYFGVILSSN